MLEANKNNEITTEQTNKKRRSFLPVVVGLAVFLVIGLAALTIYFIANNSGSNQRNTTVSTQSGPAVTPVKVDFPYTVKSITLAVIVLNGENGDLTLSNNPNMVTVYKGATEASPKIGIQDLKIGDTVNLEFVPGELANLFLAP
ncbi:hypothetical protein COS81_01475 [candidate division WWE3 bacterium CG06_land_8_20_14_3_00_42_16]|uniref:Uncharacterized protein n=3 Tax=Katanobacteria TaxID=422282 RepID=A0A2M7ANX2_UNCKA|nr:MAG: hypothetical protein COS81_01475 [candidate division WWE3 bacterium CG06_land_8_20_14_3_00_42_16]PJA38561.1 MAG: hypothetical protein CO181_00185 [candidate division WWE3 bacterium CG_4_9_14_3_um_filter_43_9]PJC68121.1 MAG: hypothetical protein CO015_05150 [candidate division WWE3 bacterium CG_4_8_14_3_um_filter_42_11]